MYLGISFISIHQSGFCFKLVLKQNFFRNFWGKLQNLLGMKLTTDLTLLFISVTYLFIFCVAPLDYQINWIKKIFLALVVGLPVQLNWISKKPSWEMMVSYKILCREWTAVRWQNTYFLINVLFNEGRKDSCYFLPTLENSWTYFHQGLGYKLLQSIMTWYMNLLSLSDRLQNAKKLVT